MTYRDVTHGNASKIGKRSPSDVRASTSAFTFHCCHSRFLKMVRFYDDKTAFVWLIYIIQSIMDHNGGSVIAMVGKDCVAIASDLRLGAGAMTIAMNFEKVSPSLPWLSDFLRCRVDLSCHRQNLLRTHGSGHGHHNSVRRFVAISRSIIVHSLIT